MDSELSRPVEEKYPVTTETILQLLDEIKKYTSLLEMTTNVLNVQNNQLSELRNENRDLLAKINKLRQERDGKLSKEDIMKKLQIYEYY